MAKLWELFRVLDKRWKYIAFDWEGDVFLSTKKPCVVKGDDGPVWSKMQAETFINIQYSFIFDLTPEQQTHPVNQWKNSLICRDDYKEQLGE